MKCRQAKPLLDDYINGKLSLEKKRSVAKHLLSCRVCREEAEFLGHYLTQVQSMPTMKAPDGFLAAVRTGISAGEKSPSPGLLARLIRFLFLPMRFKLPLEAAGILATACIAYFFIIPILTTSPEYPIQVAEHADKRVLAKARPESTVADRVSTTVSPAGKTRRTLDHTSSAGDDSPKLLEINLAVNRITLPGEPSVSDLSSREESLDELPASESVSSPARESAGIRADSTISKSESQPSRSRSLTRVDTETSPTAAVRNIALSVNGKIIREKSPSGGKPAFVTVELPENRYIDFINKIDSIGTVQEKPAGAAALNRRNVQIQVNVINSTKSD